ncbi:SusC/RagA family TonB-linked outer membrane protein [Pedobacter sp. HMWF019]|nr:SusC/RagA family TonB-linked outer membrane protein [Pedobacter sp. HMWF019]
MKINLNRLIQKDEIRHAISKSQSHFNSAFSPDAQRKSFLKKTRNNILMKVQIIAILMGIGLFQVHGNTYAQNITLHRKNSGLETILKEFERQSGYTLFYKQNEVTAVNDVSIELTNVPLRQALQNTLQNLGFSFEFFDKTIVLKKNLPSPSSTSNKTAEPLFSQNYIIGKVIDENEKPIAGVTIKLKSNPSKAVTSQENGVFKLPVSAENEILIISCIGYEVQEVKSSFNPDKMIIKMKKKDFDLGEVVVTGTGINRNKDSFTGTTAKFSGDELKAISNNNIIQSLKTLDPSFLQIENNLSGSNPNVMPVIEVRGKSSIPSTTLKDQFGSDPNQPLFVLDGFPTSLETIVDLDMNRIASVTILKDAASTALYGSQASNGVVVIETIKPLPGKLRFTYTQDFRLEMPDLTAYNMMNAVEKLEFERLSGRYTEDTNPDLAIFLDKLYNTHLSYVKKGMDSYWLSEPLQNGYSTNSSINASGGDAAFTYNVGMNYRIGKGAMKGSERNSYSGSINLMYRKNGLNINNITYIRGNKSSESPYGSFAKYVNTNPYYEKNYDNPFLEISRQANGTGTTLYVTNPLYDAMQPQYNNSTSMAVQNNFNTNYDFTTSLKLNVAIEITKGSSVSKNYKSPQMSEFANTPILRKGKYSDFRNDNFSYQGNLMLTFYKTLADKHSITANWRSTISESNNSAYNTTAEGFPEGNLGNPRFAYNYPQDASPSASSNVYRSLNTTVSVNYAYDNKYLFDFVYRLDGSTAYGSNKQFSPYYAFGLGWNLHKEDFIKNQSWINSLRLTGNIGVTGNQNFANISSISIYNYNTKSNYNQFGQGVSLDMLGNPNLEPQKTRQISTSLDFSFFNNRFSGYINAYDKQTNPLIVPVDLPSSTGVFSYPYNVGSLNYKGMEAKLTFFPIYNLSKGFTWSVGITASSYKSKYAGFGNILATLNKQQETNKSLVRYYDGNSAEAIWAIKSVGIDPTTGREVFVTKDGQYTFDYNAANIVNVGNTVAIAEGVISTNLRYKGFTFGMGLRYKIGGDVFNNALFNKVENISQTSIANNQDKRALYDRWKSPGDIAQFKGISLTSTSPISSRFVQKANTLSSESLNIGYLFEKTPWLTQLGLRSLSTNFLANDFLYLSTIKRERGIDYPYARTVALSLRASF